MRFSAKSQHNRPIRALLQHYGDTWTPILFEWKENSSCTEIALSQDIKNFSCSFQASALETKPILTFHLGQIPAYAGGVSNPTWNTDVWIDNVSLARSQ